MRFALIFLISLLSFHCEVFSQKTEFKVMAKKYSQSKLKEFKGLFDIGLYEQEDLDNLELRMNSLFDKV